MEQIQPLRVHKYDNCNGVIVHVEDPMDPEVFVAALRASISEWRQAVRSLSQLRLAVSRYNTRRGFAE